MDTESVFFTIGGILIYLFGMFIGATFTQNSGISQKDILNGVYQIETVKNGRIECRYLIYEGKIVEESCTVAK